MKTGNCPKCRSGEIYKAAGIGLDCGIKADSSQSLLNLHTDTGGIFGDKFELLYLDSYVCQNCGYTEQYVNDLNRLSLLGDTKNWKKEGVIKQ